ncbi:hypothetical protein ACIOWK_34465 [Pseudomonas protegens]
MPNEEREHRKILEKAVVDDGQPSNNSKKFATSSMGSRVDINDMASHWLK